jgi:EmrB/QacA subfamily drug resistance transporter
MLNARLLLDERPAQARLTQLPHYRWLIVGTVCVGAFLGQLDASIAGLLLPTLEEVFRAPVASVEWVSLAYLLTLAALVVPFGRLADLMGRKALYTNGFLLFIFGSALCGTAPDLGWLIAFRVVQAVGAAMLQANSVAIITAAVQPRELGRAIGFQGAAQAVGLSIGPSVGGMLIATVSWQWGFLIAVPFGVVGAVLGWLVLPTAPRPVGAAERDARFDWMGAALFGPSIALALLALTSASAGNQAGLELLAPAAGAVALLAAFVRTERRVSSPLVDLAMFRNRLFSASIAAGLLSYAVLFGSLFLLPFGLERMLGRGPAEAGLLLSPLAIALAVVAPGAGLLTDRLGSRLPTVGGMLMSAVALGGFAAAPFAPLPVVMGLLTLLGAGLGLFTPANNSTIVASAPPQHYGVAAGMLNMTRSLGTSLGVAATGAGLSLRLSSYVGHPVERTLDVPPQIFGAAFQEVVLALSLLAVITALLAAARDAPGAVGNPSDPIHHVRAAE